MFMNLLDTINADLKAAMIAKNETELLTIRSLIAAIKNKRVEVSRNTVLSDDDILALVRSEIKKRKDSIEAYTQGNRQDLADKEKVEMKILTRYMPEQLSAEELEKIASEVLAKMPDLTAKDFGRAMGVVMAAVKGKADGGAVSAVVKKILGN